MVFPRSILLLFAAAAAAAPLPAQEVEPDLAAHVEWLAAGAREEIPWRVRIEGPRLGFDQRLRVQIEISLEGRTLNRRGGDHDLVFVARMADTDGLWLRGHALRRAQIEQRLPRRARVVVRMAAVVRPGRYRVGVVMLDRHSGARNVFLAPLEVAPLRNDPLADAWQGLPAVEFLTPVEGGGAIELHRIGSPLVLAVANTRPVEVELLAVLSASEQYAGSLAAQRATFARVLPALDVFAGLSLARGSVRLTAVDLVRRRVAFEQDLTGRRINWPVLREALEEINPRVVSAGALEARQQRGAWFRALVEERLAAAPPSGAASPAAPPPRRVFIILSPAQLFPQRSDLRPVTPPGACDCTFYHLEFRLERENLWDQIGRILRPLAPRRRVIEQPIDLRRAIAEILEDLRRT